MFGFLKKKPVAVLKTSNFVFKKAIENKIPEAALTYTLDLWDANPFNFSIAGSRKTCLGNYMFKQKQHYITVNGDSNPYSFLITLIHEIAHQHVTLKYNSERKTVSPHGIEWKNTFSHLMKPLINLDVFPSDVQKVLYIHMLNPAASSTKDPALVKVLNNYSVNNIPSNNVYLENLTLGQIFIFNKKTYQKLESRRTRTLVQQVNTKKKYTISSHAEVQTLE